MRIRTSIAPLACGLALALSGCQGAKPPAAAPAAAPAAPAAPPQVLLTVAPGGEVRIGGRVEQGPDCKRLPDSADWTFETDPAPTLGVLRVIPESFVVKRDRSGSASGANCNETPVEGLAAYYDAGPATGEDAFRLILTSPLGYQQVYRMRITVR